MASTTISDTKKASVIYYHSLNAAIHAGQYDGIIPVSELIQEGTLGLGSFEKLSYEYVMLDGVAYGIPDNGKVYEMPDSALIAFGVVKDFQPDSSLTIKDKTERKELELLLDAKLNTNSFVAMRVKGKANKIRYRTFHTQQKPYKPSKDVEHVIFEKTDIYVDMVGFYTPENAKVLNSPVYHFHFIDQAKTTGGHVLDFIIEDAIIEIDHANELKVQLPTLESVEHIDLNKPKT